MTTPGDQAGPTQIRVYEHPHALVQITGPTEAAVLRRTADWLDSFDGSVVVIATNWRSDEEAPLYRMDLTVDMSVAVGEDRWPRNWFRRQG
jgi:hypothetical protein